MGATVNWGTVAASRTIAGDTLKEIGIARDNVYVLAADLARTCAIKGCKESFPERFINAGIAEQDMMGIAAGLALEGNIPYVTTMATFATMRACEQLRTDICYQNLKVRVICNNCGLTSSGGSTHNAMEYLGLTRSMANLTIVVPGDPNMARDAILATVDVPGPVIIFLARGKGEPVVYEPNEVNYVLGKAIETRPGSDLTIIACGVMVAQAVAASEALKQEGISCRVLDMHTIKPIDEEAILKAAEETGHILTLEDHYTIGGLGSAVAEVLADNSVGCRLKRMGIPQIYPGFGSGTELYEKYGFGLADTIKEAKKLIGR